MKKVKNIISMAYQYLKKIFQTEKKVEKLRICYDNGKLIFVGEYLDREKNGK